MNSCKMNLDKINEIIMRKNVSYYKNTYVFDKFRLGRGVGKGEGDWAKDVMHIPNCIRDIVYQYSGTLLDKVRVIQRAWRRYTACNPYVKDYYPHIDTIVKNMYPMVNKKHLLRQSNSGFDKWCCPYEFMGWGYRIPYWNIVVNLYRNRLIHYGHGNLPDHVKRWYNNKIKKGREVDAKGVGVDATKKMLSGFNCEAEGLGIYNNVSLSHIPVMRSKFPNNIYFRLDCI
jgi:hypothetical protein